MPVHDELSSAMGARRGTDAADTLCRACVSLLGVDAAAISLVFDGENSGTLGASSADARAYDELQFTVGEGPCLDSVTDRALVLVADLVKETRWPAYVQSLLSFDVRSVFAVPVILAGEYVGALELYRRTPGGLEPDQLHGALSAAILAELPILDLLTEELATGIENAHSNAWTELASLTRLEVSEATGVLIAQLGVDPADALVRLRAHAYATDRSATEVARDIVHHGLRLEVDR